MLWHQAVASVHFEFFEVTNPIPTYRWGGGFAAGPSGTREVWHIDVICQIDDSEITVGTHDASLADHVTEQQLVQWQLEQQAAQLCGEWAIEPPAAQRTSDGIDVRIRSDDRVVDVDGDDVLFTGFNVADGAAWAGVGSLPDGRVIVTTIRGPAQIHELGVCTDHTISDRPPIDAAPGMCRNHSWPEQLTGRQSTHSAGTSLADDGHVKHFALLSLFRAAVPHIEQTPTMVRWPPQPDR